MIETEQSFQSIKTSIAPEGSSLYYATLYYPEPIQCALIILHAFYREVHAVIDTISDPGIAKIKLNWWCNELGLIEQNNSLHPLGKLLANVHSQFKINFQHLHSIINSVENQIQIQYTTESERDIHLQKSIGELWKLCSTLNTERNKPITDCIVNCACTIAKIEQVMNFHKHLQLNRCSFSAETLQSKNLSITTLKNLSANTISTELLQPALAELAKSLNQQQQTLTEQKSFLFGIIMSKIYLARCDKAKKRTGPQQADLLPIQKLWYAWRSYRRFGLE